MNVPLPLEYQAPFEAWQFFYWISLMLSTSMCFGAIVLDLVRSRVKIPDWFLIIGGIGLLYMWGFPYNIGIGIFVIMVMAELGAPIGALFLCVGFCIFCWIICFRCIFIQSLNYRRGPS